MAEGMNFVSAAKVTELLSYQDLIPTIESALVKFSTGKVVQPVRSVIPVTRHEGFFGMMPCLSHEDDVIGTKLVCFYPQNLTRHNVPTHNAVIVLFDAKLGLPIATLDGEVITTMRTAAASAVATKYLAPDNSEILSILGSGVQARSHYEAISSFMKFKQVRVWSKTPENAQKFAKEINAVACSTAKEAVMDADVIFTVTSATKPVLLKEWVKPGAHISAVGACRFDWQELDPDLVTSSTVYTDSREAAQTESGDIIISKAEIYAELGEMISGSKEAYRDRTTVFKSLGIAIEDLVSAKLVTDLLAKQLGKK